jgi:3-oxoacyl-[acyl-carrier-protein] synthase III
MLLLDLQAACSSFIYGMSTAAAIFNQEDIKRLAFNGSR